MTTSVSKCSIFIAFLWLLLLLSSINGVQIMSDNLCGNPSETFSGIACIHSDQCDTHCKEKEGALAGGCHMLDCWCEFSCENLCGKPSGIWKGPCFIDPHCSKQCREKENSLRGRCTGFECWCVYNCSK